MNARVEVDFNSKDDFGFVPALLEPDTERLRVGMRVDAFDDEGHRCVAIVVAVHGPEIALYPLWASFASPDDARVVINGMSPGLAAKATNRLTLSIDRVEPIRQWRRPGTSQDLVPA